VTPFLDLSALSAAVAGAGWGPLEVLAATGSTNADVAALARAGAPHGAVEVTGWQQAGRGRFDRVWESPQDTCVALSVLVRPRAPLSSWGWLSLLVGLAVADGIRETCGLAAGLKWPNDVMIGERKVSGILCEVVRSDAGVAAVLGMGINVALSAEQLPVPGATSLLVEGSRPDAAPLAGAVLQALARWYERWDAGDSLAGAYRERCTTLGRRVRVLTTGGAVLGEACEVDASGALIVRTAAGLRTFAAGDVVHLRPGEH
jgi:BirA family biotin operon repressor/biotin-[acetyl-CoA-carboxylase] ligase